MVRPPCNCWLSKTEIHDVEVACNGITSVPNFDLICPEALELKHRGSRMYEQIRSDRCVHFVHAMQKCTIELAYKFNSMRARFEEWKLATAGSKYTWKLWTVVNSWSHTNVSMLGGNPLQQQVYRTKHKVFCTFLSGNLNNVKVLY